MTTSKRILSALAVLGALTIPAVASAEPQYVYVRYGNGQPYIYVTTEPRPLHPYTVQVPAPAPRPAYDSNVGAACGTVSTNVYFAPSEASLDAYDRQALANVGYCLTRGPLSGGQIEMVIGVDGTARSLERSYERQREVTQYLSSMGVRASQLTVTRELAPGWQSDRVRFRFAGDIAPWPYL